ncbi:probable LRR receptor-like serine/threonine-protein kinase At3g47570 [Malus domestica]|uniref:probable LRR receptor-like serine/threonine-protein kinase At3g47570 n=1 Tax=Malus domestica TaxID=3750 RepID=UPI0039761CC9
MHCTMENSQNLFLIGLVLLIDYSCFLLSSASFSNYTDQHALLAIESQLTYPANGVLAGNWTIRTSFCDWIGVSCSKRRQRVTALDLSYMDLHGMISPHVGNLSFLVSLRLQNNSLHGFLPHEIGRLHRLRILALQDNQLQGSVSPTLHHCQKLKVINLRRNMVSGLVPKELGSLPMLQRLYLTANNLSGGIPTSLGNISTLHELFLDQNSLTGSFPSTLLNLSSLVFIDLRSNDNIFGNLPGDLCHYWPNIREISLSRNSFSGPFPGEIDKCKSLVLLSLSYNRLTGSIPEEIGGLQNLETLYLGGNNLTGKIPQTISNMSNLKYFSMELNNIKGSIPSGVGRLPSLVSVFFTGNGLSGVLPPEIFNISTITDIAGRDNALTGSFPSYTGGIWGPNLETLGLSTNQITGNIPSYFSNFSKLTMLDCSYNLLHGPVPMDLGNLKHLNFLVLGANKLTGEPGVLELRFLSSLFSSSSLKTLVVSENPLNGIIPDHSGNFSSSSSLRKLYAQLCQIKGHIPKTLSSLLKNLTILALTGNSISGEIPPSIGRFENLQILYLDNNSIEGFIPEELCRIGNLAELSLASNTIGGLIPSCIGNLRNLQRVFLNSNKLNSSIPVNLWNLEDLLFLDLSFNSLSGYLPPDLRMSNVLEMIDLSWNRISGDIPSIMGSFQSINSLNLSNNLFIGSIPHTFGKGLEILDLSCNNLSGPIPKSLEILKFLKYLNLSFNQLSGEIPSAGPFVNFTAQSFLVNKALCGRPGFGVQPCKNLSTRNSKTAHYFLRYAIPAVISTLILIAAIFMWRKSRKTSASVPSSEELSMAPGHRMISYHELRCATNDFSESNFLGAGSFGSVYKGSLSDGTTVAVKILNMQMEGASKSFIAECKVWRAIRHRNLVKVITTCSSPEVRALVLQYMSNGSLEEWLYSRKYCLNLFQRVSVLVDVASALEYLHQGQLEPVVHCDLKPSNILLDEDMVAHVGDFGLAKILAGNKDATQTRTLGTLGYVAPEYGSAGKVSTRGDVYSYGIMLFEIIARKRPTDGMFTEELTLRKWINASLPDGILGVVDIGLLSTEEGREMNATKRIILSIMDIGLRCSEEVPEERMDIKDVLRKLIKIKSALEM